MSLDPHFAWRRAEERDVSQLERLIEAAISRLLSPYLDPSEVAASRSIMGLDRRLIEDGTYLVVEQQDRIVGAGGWSARATLFGGDYAHGRDDSVVDPALAPARMRAMYTDPDFTRRGIGRFILAENERAAKAGGFRRATLVATMAGLPLYRACGYREIEPFREATPTGVSVPLVRMEKPLTDSASER